MIEIARNNPQYDFLGCDINEHAVKLGNNFARENGIDNLKLFQHNLCTGGICKSPILEQKQVDLLFSWATLIYIKPREISDVLLDVLSLKPKYMLVIEVEPYRNRLNLETGHPALLEPFYVRSYTEIVSRLAHSLELIVENILVQDVPTQVRNPRGGIPRSLLFQFKQAH
jgi:hypothetical protein